MEVKAEKINPYDNERSKTQQVKEMFDSIAPAYDFMNRMMTFGIDKLWRARAVKMLRRHSPRLILDVATGTGDLALLLHRKLNPHQLTGIDLSPNMIARAQAKAVDAGIAHKVSFMTGDCLALPFGAETFDCITVAYGVRNFEHLDRGLREINRVLRPGGMLAVIELSTPQSPFIRPFYRLYTRTLIPLAGRLKSHDVRAYSYLPESIAAVPQRSAMTSLIEQAGFRDAHYRQMTFGTCTMYTAFK